MSWYEGDIHYACAWNTQRARSQQATPRKRYIQQDTMLVSSGRTFESTPNGQKLRLESLGPQRRPSDLEQQLTLSFSRDDDIVTALYDAVLPLLSLLSFVSPIPWIHHRRIVES